MIINFKQFTTNLLIEILRAILRTVVNKKMPDDQWVAVKFARATRLVSSWPIKARSRFESDGLRPAGGVFLLFWRQN